MNNIPNLGDFGYVTCSVPVTKINWLSIFIYVAFGLVIAFFTYKLLEKLISKVESIRKEIEGQSKAVLSDKNLKPITEIK